MNNSKYDLESKIEKLKSIDLNAINSDSESIRLWKVYSAICKKKCQLEEKAFTISESNSSKLDMMNSYGFFDLKEQDCSLEEEYLSPLFEQMNYYHKNPSPKLLRSCVSNTTVGNDIEVIKSMVFCDNILDENLARLKEYLIKSGIKEIIESHYGCNSGITNVRLSRWSHNPQSKNTHIEEKFAKESNGSLMRDVGFHHDAGLPDDVVKVFIYKSASSCNKIVNENMV